MEENKERGLFVEMYDPNKHYGVEEFCQKIEKSNAGFANAIRYNLRKEKDFNIVDRITIYYSADDEVKGAVHNFEEFIKNETLAVEILEKDNLTEKYDLNGHETYLDTEKK